MKVLLSKIRIDGDTQARIDINYDVVATYAEKMRDGVTFPPVLTYFDGANHWLADGFHRYHGHKANAIKEIEVSIVEGTQRDAQLYSFGANDEHGLQRTVQEKRRSVLRMLDDFEWGEFSDREIARICKVSHPFVAKLREGLKEDKPATKPKAEKPAPEKEEPAEEEFEEDDELHNMAVEHQALADENQKLMNKLAVKNMEATEEEKEEALVSMEEKDARIKALEAEVVALKASRDTYQSKNADMLKQIKYLKKQLEKYEKVNA